MLNNLADNVKDPGSYLYMLFAILSIGGGVVMLNSVKVVHMVASLAVTFVSLAGLYLMLGADFVAFVQVLIYAGAVSILMIFGIMLTKHRSDAEEEATTAATGRVHEILTAVGVLALFGVLYYAIQKASFPAVPTAEANNTTLEIGKLLMSRHAIPFEIMAVLLTVALVGAIVIAKREEE
ncbi:NADH-quinone oxidoreductase subunit J [Gorillibacterium timonense]|uniref:NADH-quinone oxidoreductase subunit J n=1 Tax=Gorillibacterium timonense TaxID=1689269 RepID=UPI00071CFAE9|nr:NADH-quinone oxidoreductase subunit J [Gorillibacterium timonense]